MNKILILFVALMAAGQLEAYTDWGAFPSRREQQMIDRYNRDKYHEVAKDLRHLNDANSVANDLSSLMRLGYNSEQAQEIIRQKKLLPQPKGLDVPSTLEGQQLANRLLQLDEKIQEEKLRSQIANRERLLRSQQHARQFIRDGNNFYEWEGLSRVG